MTRRRFILTAAGVLVPALPKIAVAQGPFVALRLRNVKSPFGSVQINWGHPLAQGLGFALVFNEGAGAPYNLVSSHSTTLTGTGLKWNVRSLGLSQTHPTSGSGHYDTVTWFGTRTNRYSLFLLGQPDAVGTIQSMLDDDNNTTRIFQFRTSAGNVGQFIFFDTVPNAYTAGGTSAIAVGTNFSLAATLDASKVGTLYFNGKSEGTAAGANTIATPTTTVRVFERKVGATPQITTGGLYVANGWPARTLTASDILWLHAEPYAFLQSIPAVTYVFLRTPDAAGPAAVTPLRSLMGVGQ